MYVIHNCTVGAWNLHCKLFSGFSLTEKLFGNKRNKDLKNSLMREESLKNFEMRGGDSSSLTSVDKNDVLSLYRRKQAKEPRNLKDTYDFKRVKARNDYNIKHGVSQHDILMKRKARQAISMAPSDPLSKKMVGGVFSKDYGVSNGNLDRLRALKKQRHLKRLETDPTYAFFHNAKENGAVVNVNKLSTHTNSEYGKKVLGDLSTQYGKEFVWNKEKGTWVEHVVDPPKPSKPTPTNTTPTNKLVNKKNKSNSSNSNTSSGGRSRSTGNYSGSGGSSFGGGKKPNKPSFDNSKNQKLFENYKKGVSSHRLPKIGKSGKIALGALGLGALGLGAKSLLSNRNSNTEKKGV